MDRSWAHNPTPSHGEITDCQLQEREKLIFSKNLVPGSLTTLQWKTTQPKLFGAAQTGPEGFTKKNRKEKNTKMGGQEEGGTGKNCGMLNTTKTYYMKLKKKPSKNDKFKAKNQSIPYQPKSTTNNSPGWCQPMSEGSLQSLTSTLMLH